MGDDCGFGCKLKGIVSGGTSRVSNFIEREKTKQKFKKIYKRWDEEDNQMSKLGYNPKDKVSSTQYFIEKGKAMERGKKRATNEKRTEYYKSVENESYLKSGGMKKRANRAESYSKKAGTILDAMFPAPPKKTRRRKPTTAKKATTTRKTTPKRKSASKPRAAPKYKSSYERIMGY